MGNDSSYPYILLLCSLRCRLERSSRRTHIILGSRGEGWLHRGRYWSDQYGTDIHPYDIPSLIPFFRQIQILLSRRRSNIRAVSSINSFHILLTQPTTERHPCLPSPSSPPFPPYQPADSYSQHPHPSPLKLWRTLLRIHHCLNAASHPFSPPMLCRACPTHLSLFQHKSTTPSPLMMRLSHEPSFWATRCRLHSRRLMSRHHPSSHLCKTLQDSTACGMTQHQIGTTYLRWSSVAAQLLLCIGGMCTGAPGGRMSIGNLASGGEPKTNGSSGGLVTKLRRHNLV